MLESFFSEFPGNQPVTSLKLGFIRDVSTGNFWKCLGQASCEISKKNFFYRIPPVDAP